MAGQLKLKGHVGGKINRELAFAEAHKEYFDSKVPAKVVMEDSKVVLLEKIKKARNPSPKSHEIQR